MSAPNAQAPRLRTAFAVLLGVAVVVVAGCSGDPYPQSSLHPTSDAADAIDGLTRQIVLLAVLVFVVVQTVLLVAIVRFRRRAGQPEPKHVHGNTLVEIAWTLAPAVILVFIAVPTIQTIFLIDRDAPHDAIRVEVIGHQWWWEFRYPDLGVVTANEMHLPQGRVAELTVSSADVIHSFWVPKLMGKRDAMPGRNTRLLFRPDSVGTFWGQCAEFCGESHANMRMRVMVDAAPDFDAWAARQLDTVVTDSSNALLVRGEVAFRAIRPPTTDARGRPAPSACIVCHTVAGVSGGVLGPSLSHIGSRSTIASGLLPNDSAGLAAWLRDPAGEKPGSLMPNIDLSDEEIAALVAYLQSKQ